MNVKLMFLCIDCQWLILIGVYVRNLLCPMGAHVPGTHQDPLEAAQRCGKQKQKQTDYS